MEWVETTARTVEEAIDQALDQLGVDEQEAEWEVLEEPRPGLFGRVRGQARIRARIQPKAQPSKNDRRDRRRGRAKGEGRRADKPSATEAPANPPADTTAAIADEEPTVPTNDVDPEPTPRPNGGRNGGRESAAPAEATVEEVAEQVQSFLSGLVAAFGETAPVEVDSSPDEVLGRVDAKIGLLIGPKGQTLDAIQELTRITTQRLAPSEVRIKVDVGSYRAQRQQALERFARQVAERVRDTGKPVALEPMPAMDRKVVHDALATEDGVTTRSDGSEPRRRVVVAPVDGD